MYTFNMSHLKNKKSIRTHSGTITNASQRIFVTELVYIHLYVHTFKLFKIKYIYI